MASNPNPARVTEAGWWLMEQLLALEPGSKNGGIYADKSGYHNTRAANQAKWPGNYSIRDAPDQGGPADKAAAYDWTFPSAQGGNYGRIAVYCTRLMAASKDRNDPRMNGWREWFGQADNDSQVEGWDRRYNKSASSDDSHLWHIHLSENREKVEDFDNKRALLSVLRGETASQWLGHGGGRARVFAAGDGVLYGINSNGDLLWYRHLNPTNGGAEWASGVGAKIGSGWAMFTSVFGGDKGVLYGIKLGGDLLWYRHLNPTSESAEWATGAGARIGSGWDSFTSVFAAGNGVIYGINPGGELLWYRHLDPTTGSAQWADGVGAKIGAGWESFTKVFSGGNGVIYAVSSNGDLLWYRHLDPTGGTGSWTNQTGVKIGSGWGAFSELVYGGDGVIYAINPNGDLMWYRHLDPIGGAATWANDTGVRIGTGWNVFR